MEELQSYLIPRPWKVIHKEGCWHLPADCLSYRLPGGINLSAPLSWLQKVLTPLGSGLVPGTEAAFLDLVIEERTAILDSQAYTLACEADGIRLVGGSPGALAHGLATLAQIIQVLPSLFPGTRGEWPCLRIEDRPDFACRGVMLDVSRNKVPKLATLFDLVDMLARFKINQFQLYMEHTFAYRGHERVWQGASPYTAEEIRSLDTFCRARFVELVPNQQSFGHMHRWLVHEPYRRLAECPEGVDHAFSTIPEPFSLCPEDSQSLHFLDGLYSQLLPCFSSHQLNVGLDETFDLGMGRSAKACDAQGKTETYVNFLKKIHALAASHGRRIQFWGDIIVQRPDLVHQLPKDAVALAWGYEANHPFREEARIFGESGLDFYVCPGTSAWCSFAGRTDNMLANLTAAAVQGLANGAKGLLVTDWGDYGHHQPLPVSLPGFVAGAGQAWSAGSCLDPLAEWLDRFVFEAGSDGLGLWLLDLGNTYRCFAPVHNGHPLFFLVRYAGAPLTHERLKVIDPSGLAEFATQIKALKSRLSRLTLSCKDGPLIKKELQWCADILAWCGDLAKARLAAGPDPGVLSREVGEPLARALGQLVNRHRDQWLARNREGGLAESCGRLEKLVGILS